MIKLSLTLNHTYIRFYLFFVFQYSCMSPQFSHFKFYFYLYFLLSILIFHFKWTQDFVCIYLKIHYYYLSFFSFYLLIFISVSKSRVHIMTAYEFFSFQKIIIRCLSNLDLSLNVTYIEIIPVNY
jgi:hypothetical protein